MHIGPRHSSSCKPIVTLSGGEIMWSRNVRYLVVFVNASHFFSCSLSNSKKPFYRAFNCILGKIGGVADENVIMELVKTKCLPCLYFGLEACPVNKSVINSLEKLEKIFAQDRMN